jgi:hypothetical protein
MGYQAALEKAWSELSRLTQEKKISVRLLADEYSVDLEKKKIFSFSSDLPAKDYLSILLLHYLTQKLKKLPSPTGKWIGFRELPGGEGYFPVFQKRVLAPLAEKFGAHPETLFTAGERFQAQKSGLGAFAIILSPLENIPLFISVYPQDEEFGPEANLSFAENIRQIFCTEDIVVLSETVAHSL